MKVSYLKNTTCKNKTDVNFGMLKIIDAKTVEDMNLAIYMATTIKGGGCKPFVVANSLDRSTHVGSFYFGDLLNQSKVPGYRENGKNVLIFDEEIKTGPKLWEKPKAFIENFDNSFNNPIKMTMKELRDNYMEFKRLLIKKLRAEKTLKDAISSIAALKKTVISNFAK